jgi:hypothetical protein
MAPVRDPSDDELVRLLRGEALQVDAPEHVVRRALGVFPPPRPAPRPAVLERLVAALSFDSAAGTPLALGVRGAAAEARQLVFTAEGRDIDLRLVPVGEAGDTDFEVSGQVLGPDTAGTIVLEGGGTTRTVQLNELSEFSFGAVPVGDYTLTMQLQGAVVVVPALHLAAR